MERRFKHNRHNEFGILQKIADGYRLRTEYGFSKWYKTYDELLEDWHEL